MWQWILGDGPLQCDALKLLLVSARLQVLFGLMAHLEDFLLLYLLGQGTDYFPIYLGPALQIFPHLKCLSAAKSSSFYLFLNDFEFGEKEAFCLHIPEGMDSCIIEATHEVTSGGERTDLSPVNFGG